NPREWGLVHEDSARDSYYRVESKKHYKFSLLSKGLQICKDKPMTGASVDNTQIGGTVFKRDRVLKKTAPYYYHAQVQMFVTGLSFCDFVVWTKKEIFVASILYDKEFMTSLCKKVESFWYGQVFPAMVDELTNNDSAPNKAAVHVNISKDEPVTLPKSATKELWSVTVMNINIYETCIRKLEPRQIINDNIINILLKWERRYCSLEVSRPQVDRRTDIQHELSHHQLHVTTDINEDILNSTPATADVEQTVNTLPEVNKASTEEPLSDSQILQRPSPSQQLQPLRRSQRERKPPDRLVYCM
ncbi:Carboxypeptidase D, partial [Paramuricea clavata]